MIKLGSDNQSYVVGIGGGTGSGKTTLAGKLCERLGEENALLLQHDSYYRDLEYLTYEERCEINFDHPDSLETDLFAEHLTQLINGNSVEMPIYDFKTHRRKKETKRVEPRPIIIIDGILIYVEECLRDQIELKVFLDAAPDLRFIRRLKRDIEERGRDVDSVIHQYQSTVKPMHDEFVEPTKQYADVIFPNSYFNKKALSMLVYKMKVVLETHF